MSEPRKIAVVYQGGDRLTIDVAGHRVVVDQPVADGGADEGATPTELFVASLVACMGFFAQRFLRRNEIDPAGLSLEAVTTTAPKPHRVTRIEVTVTLPPVADELISPLQRVMTRCTVHNSLEAPPEVAVTISR